MSDRDVVVDTVFGEGLAKEVRLDQNWNEMMGESQEHMEEDQSRKQVPLE